MERVSLGASGVQISAVGFGCAGLMQSPSRTHRTALLQAAFDAGIDHFDVARMYGLGMAEGELGQFVRSVGRDRVTVATKFGIDPSGAAGRLGRFQAPARLLVQKAPALRRAVRRGGAAFATPRAYDAATATRSLDESLSALGLDYVDVLFLHAPRPGDQVSADELRSFFEQARAAGKIRAWGISQDEGLEVDFGAGFEPDGIRQLASDPLTPAPRPADIVFGVLGRTLPVLMSALRNDSRLPQAWRAELDIDPLASGELAKYILRVMLSSPATKAILYSTTDPARIATAAAAAATPPLSSDAVRRFLELVKPYAPAAA